MVWGFFNHFLVTFHFAKKDSIIPRGREGGKSFTPVRTQSPSLRDAPKDLQDSISPLPAPATLLTSPPSSPTTAQILPQDWRQAVHISDKILQFYQPTGKPFPLVLASKFPNTLNGAAPGNGPTISPESHMERETVPPM